MLKLVRYPNPVLRKGTDELNIVGEEERSVLKKMVKTMYMSRGVGLAAPQVGINKKMAVVDMGIGKLLKMINPVVLEKKGTETMEEGCLSIPNLHVNVKRAKWVKIRYLDNDGKNQTLEAKGLFARAIQHEIDHLNGTLIADYLNPIKKFFALKKFR